MKINYLHRIFIGIVLALLPVVVASAQDEIGSILSCIEQNNRELSALRSSIEADKYGYKAERTLEDPEFGFDYLWSNPDVGPRKDFSITQTLDLALIFGSRGRLANSKAELADLEYRVERQRILLEANKLCLEIVYRNALDRELGRNLAQADSLKLLMEKLYNEGSIGRKDYGEAALSATLARSEYSRNRIERDNLLTALAGMNGGEPVQLTVNELAAPEMLPADFVEWYAEAEAGSPVLAYVAQQVNVSGQTLKTEKIANAPKLTAGYMSELVKGSEFRGLTLGVTIPIWSVKNNVRQARASYEASLKYQEDAAAQYYTAMLQAYSRARGLMTVLSDLESSMSEAEATLRAVEQRCALGEAPIMELLVERSLYTSLMTSTLEARLDYRQALAELNAFRL
ncbi:MAG: TolC family protein [Candidatus Cryptobacteroides sp.]